jgi:hypothetical protein
VDRRAWNVRPGEAVARADLHERFGGNPYVRLAPSATTSNVFVFVDAQRAETGRWEDGALRVAGQRGNPPEFGSTNRAVLAHEADGRALRVFHRQGEQVVYAGEFRIDPDEPFSLVEDGGAPGVARRRLVFRLVPVGPYVEDAESRAGAVPALRARARRLQGHARSRLGRLRVALRGAVAPRLRRAPGAWEYAALGSCAAIAATTWGWTSAPVRPAVTTWFLLVCPGMALIRLLPARGALTRLVLAVASSLGLETLVATTLLEARAWSPSAVLGVLIAITVAAAALGPSSSPPALSLSRGGAGTVGGPGSRR